MIGCNLESMCSARNRAKLSSDYCVSSSYSPDEISNQHEIILRTCILCAFQNTGEKMNDCANILIQ